MARRVTTVIGIATIVLVTATGAAWCQDLDALGLGDLLGGGAGGNLGGLGGLSNLGMLGALGGGMLPGAGGGAAPTIIVSQPAMLVHGNSLYIAADGKVTKFDLVSLKKLGEAFYGTPSATATTTIQTAPTGAAPMLIEGLPTGNKPPLVPGATPSTGP